jgi:DNA-binding NarL/FixJ family response regulator
MRKKKVMVLETTLLLSAGVFSLLTGQAHLNVISLSFDNEDELFWGLENAQPDVIVMDDLTMKANLLELLTYLSDYPTVRTIVVRLGENQIDVCDKRQIQVSHLNDFLALV